MKTEKRKASNRAYRQRNKEKVNAHAKEYYHRNKEARKQWARDYRLRSKEKISERRKRDYQANAEKYKMLARIGRTKRKYGISLQEIDELIVQQNHKCGICGRSLQESRRCVDHDHNTGKIRGILCETCNLALGLFRDDLEIMKKAVEYIEKEG